MEKSPSKGGLSLSSPLAGACLRAGLPLLRTPDGPFSAASHPGIPCVSEHFNSERFKLAKHPPGPDGTGQLTLVDQAPPKPVSVTLVRISPASWAAKLSCEGQGLPSLPLRASPDSLTGTPSSFAPQGGHVDLSLWCWWAVLAWAPHSPPYHETMTESRCCCKVQR